MLEGQRPVPQKAGELPTCVRQQRGGPRRWVATWLSHWTPRAPGRPMMVMRLSAGSPHGPMYKWMMPESVRCRWSIERGFAIELCGGVLLPRRHQCEEVDRGTAFRFAIPSGGWDRSGRSEEHTSELQSLMRISYSVFCLQKKK